jgi:hypothetical protein
MAPLGLTPIAFAIGARAFETATPGNGVEKAATS